MRLLAALAFSIVSTGPVEAAPGDLDPSFGTGGMQTTSIGSSAEPWAVTVDASGRILVSGMADNDLVVVRYQPDGTLDGSFGGGGVVTIHETSGGLHGQAVAVQADGRLLVTGFGTVRRLGADGSLDPTFGAGGVVVLPEQQPVPGLTILSDQRIVVAILTPGLFSYSLRQLRRLLPDGTVDPTFTSVVVHSEEVFGTYPIEVAAMPDGRLVVAGGWDVGPFPSSNRYWALQRFLPDGIADESFGPGGLALGLPSGGGDCCTGAVAVARTPAGDLVVAGNDQYGHPFGPAATRFHDDGTLDTAFGSGGIARSIADDNGAASVVVQTDGRVVVAGGQFQLIRFMADGALDAGFGTGGIATAPLTTGPGTGGTRDLAMQADGKLVVVGTAGHRFGLARFIGDDDVACGNGHVDPGEACDGTPCCTPTCTLKLAGTSCRSSTGICDPGETCTGSSDTCPADVDHGDADADGTCDDVDACERGGGGGFQPLPPTRVVLDRIGADPTTGDDRLTVAGDLSLPTGVGFFDLDLLAHGARVLLTTAAGVTIVDGVLPPGNVAGVRGWRRNPAGRRWSYTDRSSTPVGGIVAFQARARDTLPGGRVGVRVRGRNGSYPGVVPGATPVQATLVLGDATASATGTCGVTAFLPLQCAFKRANTKLVCVR